MKKYAKIINEQTKEVSVALGSTPPVGYVKMDVEQAWNCNWYVEGYAPEKPTPTHEETSEMRKQYRRDHIDDKTAERSRKMANGSWTAEDEQEYLDLDEEVTAYIEEHFPYND